MAFIKNINAWKNKSQAAKKKIKQSATSYVRQRVLMVYKDILKVSPQWSGNYAYNWQISTRLNEVSPRWDKRFKGVHNWYKVEPKHAGDPEAINAAIRSAMGEIENIKWNSRISVVNYAPIADAIEAGTVPLRPENLIPGGMGVIAYVKTKYKFII